MAVAITKHQRRTRTVNNSYVDIDSVQVCPGGNYCNWTKITRQKLKERDSKLLNIKINEIEHIVNSIFASHNYASVDFKVSSTFIAAVLQELHHVIDYKWKGVNIPKLKKEPDTFRAYFLLGKNWWYSRKKKLIGSVFWLKLFHTLRSYIEHKPQFKRDPVLFMKVLQALFEGIVQFSNTKPLPLINHGTVIECKPLQMYLYQLDISLDIQQMMSKEKDNIKCNKGIGPLVIRQLKHRFSCIIEQRVQQLQENQSIKPKTPHKAENVQMRSVAPISLHTHFGVERNMYNPGMIARPQTNNLIRTPAPVHGYVSNHGVSYNVQSLRSSPIMTMQQVPVQVPVKVPVLYSMNSNSNNISYGIAYAYASVPVSVVTLHNP